ncbi:uncharacterized protein LOC128623815 [Ictalurus furcatus]|uniref:uncharacterized protein LOC128623815 n=1 Tax=Ictalurus furcatus TaxID=66913 RepID=UPI002350906D|nr:uncharacterized protein LOC128623815 [Ictalurus furcatus]
MIGQASSVNLATTELWLEACGEVSALELQPEVNLVTSDLQPETHREVSTAEEAFPLSCPAEEAVPHSSPAEDVPLSSSPAEDVPPSSSPAEDVAQRSSPCEDVGQRSSPVENVGQRSSPAEDVAPSSSPAVDITLSSSPAVDVAQCPSPAGGGVPSVCCPAEVALFPDISKDRLHRDPGLPLEGGFRHNLAGRWNCGEDVHSQLESTCTCLKCAWTLRLCYNGHVHLFWFLFCPRPAQLLAAVRGCALKCYQLSAIKVIGTGYLNPSRYYAHGAVLA